MTLVVAIDGPAGAGKSTTAKALAARLGFRHVDTGAMYRVVGVLADEAGIALDDDVALGRLVDGITFDEAGERIVVAGRDLTHAIRSPEAGDLASKVSTQPVVRARLVALQRRFADGGPLVMEGRDIGTVVFPDAAVKVFLTADPRERARRRAAELRARGEVVDEDALAAAIAERDCRDSERSAAPLRPAADALVVDTTTVDVPTVVERLAALVTSRGDAG
jgi:cytidylate kinase